MSAADKAAGWVMLFDGSPDPVRSAVVLHVKDGIPRYYMQVDP
jgi:hypothetical protein